MDIIGYFSDLVGELDEDGIYELLATLPYEDLDYEETMQPFLQITFDMGRKDYGKIVVEKFAEKNVREDTFPLTTEIFTYDWDDDLLAFVATCFPRIGAIDHFNNLIRQDDNSNLIKIAKRIIDIYGEMDYTLYISCLNLAESDGNYNMYLFFREKVQKTSTSASPPDWMIPSEYRQLPEPNLPQFKLPPEDVAVEVLLRGFGYMGLTVDLLDYTEEEFKDIDLKDNPSLANLVYNRKTQNIRKALEDKYRESSEEEKRQLLQPIFEHEYQVELTKDLEYFRLLGPSNPMPFQQEWDKSDRCYKYGPCRMLLCQHNQQEDDEGDEIEEENDWFGGNCDYCYRKITSRFRCVRMPLKMGGWMNVYCSMDCLRLDGRREPRNDQIDDNMVDELEKLLMKKGIYDQPEHQIVPFDIHVTPPVNLSTIRVQVPEIEQEDEF